MYRVVDVLFCFFFLFVLLLRWCLSWLFLWIHVVSLINCGGDD